MKKSYKFTAYILLAFWAGYEAHKSNLFPINHFVKRNFFEEVKQEDEGISKGIGVFADVSSKQEVPCPNPNNAFVVIGFGQSNSANHAGHRFYSKANIFNFFKGKCYVAVDPMLGATGKQGSVWIPLSEKLNVSGKTIVLATFGVGGTRVDQWLDSNYLLPFYKENLANLKQVYPKPNAAVWIQGESDKSTPQEKFTSNLIAWLDIVSADLSTTDIYLTGTSYCDGSENQQVVEAQKRLINKYNGIFVGSTDVLKDVKYRYDDCHFSEQGIKKLAELISDSWIK
jgi:hypothetical protein